MRSGRPNSSILYTDATIFPDSKDETSHNTDGKKQPQAPIPGEFRAIPHGLQDGDDQIGETGHKRCGLEDLPAGCGSG
jgi:hypothetical protein